MRSRAATGGTATGSRRRTRLGAIAGLRTAADQVERPEELGELEISVTPRGRMTAERVAAFAEAGVHRLVVLAPPTPDGPAAAIEAAVAATAAL